MLLYLYTWYFRLQVALFINHVGFDLTHNKLLVFIMSFLSIALGIELLLYMLTTGL